MLKTMWIMPKCMSTGVSRRQNCPDLISGSKISTRSEINKGRNKSIFAPKPEIKASITHNTINEVVSGGDLTGPNIFGKPRG
jgi:hypothetical protein